MLSIVIPISINEMSTNLKNELQLLEDEIKKEKVKENENEIKIEIIFVGKEESQSRAIRLNLGFHRSKGDIILFHHPRSILDLKGIQALLTLNTKSESAPPVWGGFTHRFDDSNRLLKFTSWYSNQIRSKIKGIIYLDHCIFFERRIWRVDLPSVDIFEDTILSRHFLKLSSPILLPYFSTTSAIRFKTNGVLKQSLINQILKIGFHLRISHSLLNKVYENNLSLNTEYSRKKK